MTASLLHGPARSRVVRRRAIGVHPHATGGPGIRVVVAHGDRLALAGLRALLDAEPGISVAGSAADGGEAVELAARIRPDVLVIDISLPDVDGVEVTRRILGGRGTSGARVLVLGAPEGDEEVFASLRAGARGFLPRDVAPDELAAGIRALAAGGAALSAHVLRRVIAAIASQPDPLVTPDDLDELTPREREVMELVAAGLSNGEIAEHLVISRATAKTHVSRTLLKLHARDRAQLVTLAYETGLVLPRQATVTGIDLPDAALAAA